MKKNLILFVVSVKFLGSMAYSNSESTPERVEINLLSSVIKTYEAVNDGRQPASWGDINTIYDVKRLDGIIIGTGAFSLTERYEFINQRVSMPGYEGSQILLIRTVPLQRSDSTTADKSKMWRYLIFKRKDGEVISTRFPEDKVQAMLKSANVVVTPKLGLPAVETDDVTPERGPKPQSNSQDEKYLKQYREFDPTRNGVVPTLKPVKVIPQPAMQASSTETDTNWWLILSAFIGIIAAGFMVFLVVGDKPPKR